MCSQENTALKLFSSRDTKWANSKHVFLVRDSGTLAVHLQESALFCFFWGRKQQVQHILCCDKHFYWRQERFQIFKDTVEGLEQGWVTWAPFSVTCGWCYHALCLSALNSNCKKRSHHAVFMGFFLLFSIETSLFIILIFSSGSGISLIWTLWWIGFPPPQNSLLKYYFFNFC